MVLSVAILQMRVSIDFHRFEGAASLVQPFFGQSTFACEELPKQKASSRAASDLAGSLKLFGPCQGCHCRQMAVTSGLTH